jgi:hypothetical protein
VASEAPLRLVPVHETAGRLRLRLDGDASPEAVAALADSLARIPGVRHVVVRPNTGSVILTLDLPSAEVRAAIASSGAARLVAPPKRPPVGQVLALGAMRADMEVRARSGDALDLRTALALALVGGAVIQAARGRVAGPATTLALEALALIGAGRR